MPAVTKTNARKSPKARASASRARRTQPTPRERGSFKSPRQKQARFGKRNQAPEGGLARLRALVSGGRIFAILAGGLVVGALVFGLFAGGHVAALGAAIVAESKSAVAAIGLRVDEVTVEGRNRTAPQEVLAALGVTRGASAGSWTGSLGHPAKSAVSPRSTRGRTIRFEASRRCRSRSASLPG